MNPLLSTHRNHLLPACVSRIFLALAILVLICSNIYSQNDAFTPLGLKAGTPAGSYPLTDIDTVSLFNGQVNVRVPWINEVGRGQANSQMSFTWDSPMRYQVYKSSDPYGNPMWGVGGGSTNVDGTVSYGFHAGDYNVFPLGVFSVVGSPSWCDEGLYVWTGKSLTRFYWVEPDGTQHEMRDVLTNGQPLNNGGCWSAGPYRGKVFVSTDGSGATFIADEAVRDGIYVGMEFPHNQDWSGWLLLKDGRRIRISPDNNRGVRDRNGNLLLKNPIYPTPVIDSLNRVITSGTGTPTECNAVLPGYTACSYTAYKGFGGAERRIYTFWESDGFRMILPNGTGYRFYFNSYQDLIRIDLPTGGSIEYDYGPGLTGPQPDMSMISGAMPGTYWGGPSDAHVYRRVTERRVYKEGHVLESRQTFSRPEDVYLNNLGYVDKVNYDGANNLQSTERHYFYGSAERSFLLQPTEYSSWKDGREYRTEIYDSNGNLLRTVNTFWEQRAPVNWWTGSPDDAPPNDPRVAYVTTILENGTQFSNSFGYDSTVPYNSLIEVIERDYNLNILRRRQTTYLKTLNGVDYAGLNIQTASALHMRDFPVQESVIGSGGVEEVRITYEYDNYNTDSNHAALVARPNISGHDAAFGSSYLTRGNVTAVTHHLLTNGVVTGSVTAYIQYDVAGNVVKTIDGRGNAAVFDFSDRFGTPNGEAQANTSPIELSSVGKFSYAFATRVTNAMNHVAHSQIDYYTGQPVDIEAANGIVSSAHFADPLDRPTQVIAAASNPALKTQTSFSYNDANRIVATTSDLSSYGDNLRKAETLFDGLGRTVESRTYESSSSYITVKTIYSGFISQTSNPYRQGENPLWTTTVVDALGRVKSVTTPDNAVVTTSYVGNETTVTSPTGKKLRSVSDPLGRVRDVYEDPLGANYRTTYGYDGRSNLVSVAQHTVSQAPRTFVYDSFSRLISAANPESGTTTYQYDQVGNLLVRTDARGVSLHASYDTLNRPTRRWYNGSSAITATTHNNPALPTGVGATDETSYFYDSQTLPSGAPGFTRGPSTGALVALTYGTNSSTGDYFGRDAIGRPVVKIQRTGGINYQLSLNYNVVGAISSMVYPSGRAVDYAYDGAGRLSSLAGNLGDGTGRIYASGILYSQFGGVVKEQFGTTTPVYNKLFYNSRQQLAEMRVSTSYTGPTDTTWNRGAIINHYSDQCWGMCAGSNMTDNDGNLKKQEVYIPNDDQVSSYAMRWQQYDYDALNRLKWVREIVSGVEQWKQQFTYDRWGNRTIDTGVTYGAGINNKAFTVNSANNRLGVPGGQSGVMSYDAVGNLTNDTYTGAGNRTYDAENKITSAWGGNSQAQLYGYDASGNRVKRTVNGVETWQVYGFGGELLAEYPANGVATNPQREYGYRNGQLLITAEVGSGSANNVNWTNVVGVSVSGNNLTKTAGTEWYNARASSTQAITSGEGYVEFTASETTTNRMLGLGEFGSNYYTYSNIRYAIYLAANVLYTSEYGALTNVGTYATGDTMRVAIEGAAVKYYKNGALLRTSAIALTYPLYANVALYQNGATLTGAVIHGGGGGSTAQIKWLVADHLGTPRMIFDQTGSLANVKRHDYLPFGEDLYAGVGGRTSAQGYSPDNIRQRFTSYEADLETGLNYAQARYQSSVQGRFTSVDPISGVVADPQSWNMYAYVGNNPMNRRDPSGKSYLIGGSGAKDPFIKEYNHEFDEKAKPWVEERTPYVIKGQDPKSKPAVDQGNPGPYEQDIPVIRINSKPAYGNTPEEAPDATILERYGSAPIKTTLQFIDWASQGAANVAYSLTPDFGSANFNLPLMGGAQVTVSKDRKLYGGFNLFGWAGGNYEVRKNWRAGFQFATGYFLTTEMSPEQRDDAIQGPGFNFTTGPVGAYIPASGGTPAVTLGWPWTSIGSTVSTTKRLWPN